MVKERRQGQGVLKKGLLAAFLFAFVALVAAGCESGAQETTTSDEPAAAEQQDSGELAVAAGGELLRVDEEAIPDVGEKSIGIIPICAQCTGMARFLRGFTDLAEAQGWSVTVNDAGGDMSKVIAAFNTFIQSQVDAIILGALDPTALTAQIQAANDAGIPVAVNEGAWVPGTLFSCCQHPTAMGVQQGDWIASRLKGEGKVVTFELKGAKTVEERARTFKAVMSLYPDIEIVQTFQVDVADPIGAAKEQMANYLLRNPDVSAVWAGWDDPARGAAQAIAESGRSDAFVIGNDAGPDALDDIRGDSPLDGTIFIDYITSGKIFVQELAREFSGDGVTARQLYVQQPIISRHLDNVPPQGQEPPAVGYFAIWPASAEEGAQ